MRTKLVYFALGLVLLSPTIILGSAAQENQPEKLVLWVDIKDFIGSGTVDHMSLAVQEVSDGRYSAIVLGINTFGGSVDSTFRIISSIQSSAVPVIGFVYPAGKQALSTGTYILMATDLAVMAPFTKIGSAQPVVGGIPVNDTKTINALLKEMEGLAEIHDRNRTQLSRFITDNDNLLAEEALRNGAIELVASSKDELLELADGITVMTIDGEIVLDLDGARFVTFQEVPRVTIVRALSDPVISSLLVSIGILILILGITSPGFGAEIGGVVLLILGLIGQGFDVNYGALGLMGIGAALLIFELYTPSFGILGVGGIAVLGGGAIFFVTRPPGPILISPDAFNVFIQTIIGVLAIAAVLFGVLIYKFVQIRKKKTPIQKFPTGEGRSVDNIPSEGEGYVVVQGEYWKATSREKISAGDRVMVVGNLEKKLIVERLRLTVVSEEDKESKADGSD